MSPGIADSYSESSSISLAQRSIRMFRTPLPSVRLTLSHLARKHEANCTIQAHASIQRLYRTAVSPIFSVHKMVADAPPDVMSPTFLTYFSLRASGPLGDGSAPAAFRGHFNTFPCWVRDFLVLERTGMPSQTGHWGNQVFLLPSATPVRRSSTGKCRCSDGNDRGHHLQL